MMRKELESQIKALAIFPKLLWGAMFSSVGVLTAVQFALQQSPAGSSTSPSANTGLSEPFAVVASVLALLVLWLRSRLVSGRGLGPAQRNSVVASSADEAQQVRRRAAQLLPLFIVACALSEAITILGFVMAHLSKDPEQMVPFVAASVVLFLALFPNLPRWAGASRE
jgi:F0F1-type ATP synthase membrane subunit c/vacuolar-type H+-ATPase subunit K